MIRTLVFGAGRMARRVVTLLQEHPEYELLGVVARSRPEGLVAINWQASFDDADTTADLLIDFTLPGAIQAAADWCASHGVAILSGTTGLLKSDLNALEKAAVKVPVLWASNLSLGVALMTSLVQQAAGVMGVTANISIHDTHHRNKLDAPSGTALTLAAAILEARSEPLEKMLEPHHIKALAEQSDGELTFSSSREGEVVGQHTVSFNLPGESIDITHTALDRDIFASGALKAGEWLVKQVPGQYSTHDWLGLR